MHLSAAIGNCFICSRGKSTEGDQSRALYASFLFRHCWAQCINPSTLQPYKYIAMCREIQHSGTAQIHCVALSTLSPRQAAFSRCPFSDDYRGNFYHSYFSPPPSLAPCLSLFFSAGWKMSFSHGHPQAGRRLMRHISPVFTRLATQTIPRYNHSV